MLAPLRSPERAFLAVLAMTIGSFCLSTGVANSTASTNRSRERGITRSALPSIEHLATVRTELRHALMLADDLMVAGANQPVARIDLDTTRALLSTELASYAALPHFPSEAEPSQRLGAEFTELSGALADEEFQLGIDPARAREINLQWVHPAIDHISSTAFKLLDLNATTADELARQMEATRKEAEVASFGLDALCAILCCLAGYLAWRTTRLYLAALEAQRRLLEERATELEAFSGRVAHDILSPLGAVSLALGILERQGPSGLALSRGKSSLNRAVRIVDGLLSFAKAGAKPEPGAVAEVRPVLDDALAGVAGQAAEAKVTVHAEPISDCEVACHPGVLASMVTNLVVNAIKYMGDSPERKITLRVRAEGPVVHFEVQDTGAGIPQAMLERVFEPYVRASSGGPPGIGLGLATVKKLCVAHGGRVGLRSELGRGSVFWFELPSPWEVRVAATEAMQPAHP